MLDNYIKIALRNMRRNPVQTFINISGLAVGIACFILIMLYVIDELSYDRFHKKADRIYRVVLNTYLPDAPPDRMAISNWVTSPTLLAEYPEVENVTRLAPWHATVKHGGHYFFDDKFFFADSTFFNVFTFPLIQGESASALRDPFSLVMTEEMEQKYFGSESGLGNTVILNDTIPFMVTGILPDIPSNSHFTFDFLVSWTSFEHFQPRTDQYTYVLLYEKASAGTFEAKISDLIMRSNIGDRLRESGIRAELELQPLTNIYLHSDRSLEIGSTGSIQYVYLFVLIAGFVLLIACINFMNLSTARSMERAKEIGVRKVVGSTRTALVRQFLCESILIAFFAFIAAGVIVEAALPFFTDLTAKDMSLQALINPFIIIGIILLMVIVGLLAGSYPAFMLSRIKPVEVLKGPFKSTRHGMRLRQGFVIFQFAVSVVLIGGTLIVFKQIHFMQHQHLGFTKEQVIVMNATGIPDRQMEQQYRTVKKQIKQHSSVLEVSTSNTVPGRGSWVYFVSAEGLAEDDSRRVHGVITDEDFLRTMGIELVAGRGFSAEFETDVQEAVLLNEAAVESFGWHSPEEAVGKYIRFGDVQKSTVIGVIKNYHHRSLHQKIEPILMRIIPSTFNFFSVRFITQDVSALMAHLEKTWQRLFPGVEFEYFFLDDDYNQQYRGEQRLFTFFITFAFLAVFIACLGMFGLATHAAERRTKEIGIRKVLGGSVMSIVFLLVTEFLKLVVIGFAISVPVAWYAMNRWLENFAYRIDVSMWIFLLAGLTAIFIAVITVIWQSIRSALGNPVDALRYE